LFEVSNIKEITNEEDELTPQSKSQQLQLHKVKEKNANRGFHRSKTTNDDRGSRATT